MSIKQKQALLVFYGLLGPGDIAADYPALTTDDLEAIQEELNVA